MKRKLICLLLMAVMLALNLTGVLGQEIIQGDADGSGQLTSNDCTVIIQKVLDSSYTMPVEALTEDHMSVTDVNGDIMLTSADAAYVLQKVLFDGFEPAPVTCESDIVLADNGTTVNGILESNGGVDLDNESNVVTITNGGSYNVSGTLTNGQLVVDADSDVEINLNGVSITNESGSAIYGLNGDIDISAKKGTVNTLYDGTPAEVDADGEPDACIFSHDSIKLKGTGELTINGNYSNGVSTKDSLTVQKLSLTVNSVNNCLKGKDNVVITSGNLDLTSAEGDGIRCTKGDLTVNGGTITVKAEDNGLFAKTGNIIINDGEINIDTDTQNADTDTYNYDGVHSKAGSVSLNGGSLTVISYCDGVQAAADLSVGDAKVNITTTGVMSTNTSGAPMWQDSTDTGISAKGLKSDGTIVIGKGADITVNSTDDSIHANDTAEINGGIMLLSSGDDGIHADNMLTVNAGEIDITKSYEGLEAENIYINGGNIHILADDDSINAAGGNDASGNFGFGPETSTGYMEFNGGYIYCENTKDGDGIDSNGSIVINGGTIIINGPSSNGNAPVDYGDSGDSYFAYNGGSLIAVGSAGMAVKPGEGRSAGYSVYYGGSSGNKGGFDGSFGGGRGPGGMSSSTGISAGKLICLTDSSSNVLAAFEPRTNADSILICSDSITAGETYTLTIGGAYSGTLNEDGYSVGGTVSDSKAVASATVSGKVTVMS